ncbi:hypothetical protein ACFQ51_46890 [Streptomyces kaempferi]
MAARSSGPSAQSSAPDPTPAGPSPYAETAYVQSSKSEASGATHGTGKVFWSLTLRNCASASHSAPIASASWSATSSSASGAP